MIKLVVSAAALSFALVSAAWALPAAPRSERPTLHQSDIIQIGKKDRGHDGRRHGDYGGGKHYRGRSYHGGGPTMADAPTMAAAIGDAVITTVPTIGRYWVASSSAVWYCP